MAQTDQAFRRIVVLYPHQADLETEHPHYHVIANNPPPIRPTTCSGAARGGESSENDIKELKPGFGIERMPCDQKSANAAFFRLGGESRRRLPCAQEHEDLIELKKTLAEP
jgi:hypothetical protein